MKTLLRLEWRHVRRDPAFWLATFILAAALLYGLANGFAWTRFQAAARSQAETLAADKLAAARTDAAKFDAAPPTNLNPNLDPRDARGFEFAYLRRFAVLPPAPAAALAVGQSDLLPSVLRVTYRPRESFLNHYEIENPLRLLLGRFDATFVALYLLPLAILVIAHGLLARERDGGTLALLRAQPISLARWLAARFLLRGGLVLGVFALTTVLGWLALGGAPSALGAVAAWLALALAYGVFWFALAWWIGTRAATASSSALTLAGAWLILVVLFPAGLNLTLKQLYPPPSRAAFQDSLRDGTDDAAHRGSQLLAQYLEDHPELAPGSTPANENDFFRTRFAVNAEIERLAAPLRAAFAAQLARQQTVIERLRWFSPALVLHHGALTLAGTDRTRHQRWLDAVGDLHARTVDFFEPRLLRSANFRDYDQVPALDFRDPPASRAALLAALAALLLPAAALVLFGTRTLRRSSLSS
jgi:ABC-2 type transport system permease protein